MERIDGKFWGICSTCNRHRPIAYKIGESPYHQWCCIDCDQPTAIEIAKLREENQRLKDQRDVAIADYRIALNELEAIIAWVDGPEMQRYNTSIARMILKGAKQ